MATDAKFDKIQKIVPHENADSLEVAIVSNFPCVVRKGEFKEGDWCFYIRDDASLIGWQEKKDRLERDAEAAKTGGFVTQDCFHCTFPWQESLLGYLGSGGRVKTIRLRGQISMGILLKIKTIWLDDSTLYAINNAKSTKLVDEAFERINSHISNAIYGAEYLEKNFGVKHWVMPLGAANVGDLNMLHQGLEDGVKKSDEENFENLPESDLHLGKKALITKKLDGTSCTVICRADGTYAITSRSNTLRPECDNVYTRHTKEALNAGLWYAKKHNCTIAFQGEVCCESVQRMGINKDKMLNDFFVYKTYFPNEENWHLKMGTYGTKSHFTDVVKECNDNGFNVKTVPVLGIETLSRELLESYTNKPADLGEGIVVNVMVEDCNDMCSLVWDYKAKSREYLMKIK